MLEHAEPEDAKLIIVLQLADAEALGDDAPAEPTAYLMLARGLYLEEPRNFQIIQELKGRKSITPLR